MSSSTLSNTTLTFYSDTPGTDVNSRLDASSADTITLFADNATNSGTVSLANIAQLQFAGSVNGSTEQLTLTVPSTITSSYTITFPNAQGSSTQVLVNDGAGNLSWQNQSGSSSVTFTDVSSSTYTILGSDSILGVSHTATASVTLTLPPASDGVIIYYIKDSGGNAFLNNITINPDGADTIDGDTELIITGNYDAVTLASDGTSAWYIL